MRITKENINEFIKDSLMSCPNKGITHIEYIPDGITRLDCWNNKLTELPKLPNSLYYLDCKHNNLPYLINIDNFKEHNTLIKRKEILSKICG